MKYKYCYFVSYSHEKGTGSLIIYRQKPINSEEETISIRKFISETSGNPCIILTWKLLQRRLFRGISFTGNNTN